MKNQRLFIKESTILEWVFVSALLLFFFADAANKILLYKGVEFNRVSILVRAFYEMLFIGIIILYPNKTRIWFLVSLAAWFGVFFIGQIFLSMKVDYQYNYIENVTIFNKYVFVFIIYFSLYAYQNFAGKFRKLLKILEILFLGNSFLIILGFIFNIALFTAYLKNDSYTYRFGYSGLIPAQNEATLFAFLALSYFYHKHFITGLKSWKFYIILISVLLMGTKGIYLYLILLFIFHAFSNSTKKARRIAFYVLLGAILGILIFLQSDFSKFYFGYFISKFNAHGLLYVLLSGRNIYVMTRFIEIISYWNPFNFFIGGQDQTKFLIEMDFFDAFLFFGLIGCFILFSFYFKALFRFNLRKPFYLFFVINFFLIAFFAGHFLTSAINALYLSIVCMYFYISQEQGEKFWKSEKT